MPTRRQERVSKRIMQELVDAFRNLKNADLGFITITRCEVSPDLRHAKVFISVFGDDKRIEKTLGELRQNATRLKGLIGRPLGTKVIPTLHFEYDDAIASADAMSRLIRDARSTDSNPTPLTPEEVLELAGGKTPERQSAGRVGGDLFEQARMDVEEDLLGGDEDPDWRPINLDELPEDEDEDEDEDVGEEKNEGGDDSNKGVMDKKDDAGKGGDK